MNTKKGPESYEEWMDLERIIIPCSKGLPVVKAWSESGFKITKEDWKNKHLHNEIALRLDQDIDFDIDNELVKRFVEHYIKVSGAISGRPTNPTSHYWWKGELANKKFTLPKEFEEFYNKYPHGATLCEIRSGSGQYTIVPGSLHSKNHENVRWEKYEGIQEYPGNLNMDLRKVALSTALCILYPSKGKRDEYCAAIAGVLLKKAKWKPEDIDAFVYNIARAANDDESEKRASKGTSGEGAQRNLGIPTITKLLECSQKGVSEIFSWIGVDYATIEATGAIGDIIDYGQDRYLIKVTGRLEDKIITTEIRIDGPTLRNQKLFYDAVMRQAGVWIPNMIPKDYEDIMRKKYESRIKSKEYEDEASEDLVFKKRFINYVKLKGLDTDKKNLLEYNTPYAGEQDGSIEFNLTDFEDYLETKRVNIKRVDLVLNVQKILKAKKIKGKVNMGTEEKKEYKSCVSWRIKDFSIDNKDLTIEGEVDEVTEVKEITDGS